MQLHAGYFIEELLPHLCQAAGEEPKAAEKRVRALLQELAFFDVASNKPFAAGDPDYDPKGCHYTVFAVAANLLMRGLPTRAPAALAAATLAEHWPGAPLFLAANGQIDLAVIDAADTGALRFALPVVPDEAAWAQLLWRALHPIDPTLPPAKVTAAWKFVTDSFSEQKFASELLPAQAAPFLTQLLQPQTKLDNLLTWGLDEAAHLARHPERPLGQFVEQDADFTLAFPYPWEPAQAGERPTGSPYLWPKAVQGLVLEVDGPTHREPAQKIKDGQRDTAALSAGWFPVRLPVSNLVFDDPTARLAPVRDALAHPYLVQMQTNCKSWLTATPEGRRALQLTLGPLAVARVQRTLLEALLNGTIQFNKATIAWKLAVVERDVPCAQQAVALLLEDLRRLYLLVGREWQVPAVELHVFPAAHFDQPTLLTHPETVVMDPGTTPHADDKYDLLLDVSVLQRSGITKAIELPGVASLTIRTAHRARQARRFRSAPLLTYKEMVTYDPAQETYRCDEQGQKARVAALTGFVQDVYRVRGLREGQLPIISRGLQGQSVLGLLPTGGGKSLTYQIAVLLQPGLALVVDPIKSLMQDQMEGLARNWMDGATFLNSSVRGKVQKEYRLAQLHSGGLQFLFISPERLVIEDFREQLLKLQAAVPRVAFSYCVIDEAHCVSEWGHDFRTPYLKLGENARRFCHPYVINDGKLIEGKSTEDKTVPLYGLTATASFDVLADVQRELHLDDDQSAVIRTANMARPELHIKVLPVELKKGAVTDRKSIAAVKLQMLEKLLPQISEQVRALDGKEALKVEGPAPDLAPILPRKLNEWTDFFGPDAAGKCNQAGLVFCPHRKGAVGVEHVRLSLTAMQSAGPLRVGYFMGADDKEKDKEEKQKEMEGMQTAFVAADLNLMVATKAFGMGIDKPNVRFTVHYAYPSSIESFVQEGGRAGRDRAVALNYILYHEHDEEIQQFFFKNAFKAQEHEVMMMHELLTEITFPSRACGMLNEALSEAFPELVINARLWTKKAGTTPEAIYLNGEDGLSYGRIVISNPQSFSGYIEDKLPAAAYSVIKEVVNFAVNYLVQNLKPADRTSIQNVVAALGGGAASTPGIIPRLDAMERGEDSGEPLVVGFENGTLTELCEAAAQYGLRCTEAQLVKHLANNETGLAFAQSVGMDFPDERGVMGLPPALEKIFGQKFWHIRRESDTFKAIHRLCLLGVVADYTIQYSGSTVTLKLAPRQEEENLLTTYQTYLARYTTPEKAQAQAQAVPQAKGDHLLHKLAGALIDFNAREIKDKRRVGMAAMKEACKLGIKGENLSEYFDLYFNSKYARTEYLPDDTQQGKSFDEATVFKYLDYMVAPPDKRGFERDNIKHLRGACTRLLTASPHNGAFLLLGAFATLYLELTKPEELRIASLVAGAQQQLFDGFVAFHKNETTELAALVAFVQKFAAATGKYYTPIGKYITENIEQPLQFQLHLEWLTAFNARFIDIDVSTPTF